MFSKKNYGAQRQSYLAMSSKQKLPSSYKLSKRPSLLSSLVSSKKLDEPEYLIEAKKNVSEKKAEFDKIEKFFLDRGGKSSKADSDSMEKALDELIEAEIELCKSNIKYKYGTKKIGGKKKTKKRKGKKARKTRRR